MSDAKTTPTTPMSFVPGYDYWQRSMHDNLDRMKAFYDEYAKLNAFLHSHSYSGNPLACAAALATLDLFVQGDVLNRNRALAQKLAAAAAPLADHPNVAEVRQLGMILAVEFVRDRGTREPFAWQERRHLRIHRHALSRGVLLRPIGNVLYFMPPYVITPQEIDLLADVAGTAIEAMTCE